MGLIRARRMDVPSPAEVPRMSDADFCAKVRRARRLIMISNYWLLA